MRRLVSWLVLGLAFALAAPSPAQQGSAAAAEEAEQDDASEWVHRLDEAAARLATARRRLASLEDTKGRGASRRYPRGTAKEKYLEDLAGARADLAEARESLPELLEEARQAGVEPGVLDRYESAADDDADAEDEDES